jgi:flavorubredoxin
VISSLALWWALNPDICCHLSGLWQTFIAHFAANQLSLQAIADQGREIKLGQLTRHSIPAHYLHSWGNLQLFDPLAKILFSASELSGPSSDPSNRDCQAISGVGNRGG